MNSEELGKRIKDDVVADTHNPSLSERSLQEICSAVSKAETPARQ